MAVPSSLRPICCALFLAVGCGRTPTTVEPSAVSANTSALVADGSRDPRYLALESRPLAAAQSLPTGAHYRVLVVNPRQIVAIVAAPDGRLVGRVHIQPRGDIGASIVLDDFDGPKTTIDAWTSPTGLAGVATVGAKRADWEVRLAADGSLAGERWSVRHGSRSPELARARAIGADLRDLTDSLGSLDPEQKRELCELVSLAELALELSVRAWSGRGRARLPPLSSRPLD